jgi:hypothetical protein
MGSGKVRGKTRAGGRDATRGNPKPDGKIKHAAGVSPDELQKLDELPPGQRQALEDLQLGRTNGAGLEFKHHESEPDHSTVPQRPPMPNESTRTDQDRLGGRDKN